MREGYSTPFVFFFLPSFWGDYPFSRSLSHSHSLSVPLCKPFSSRLEVITSNKTTDSESVRCRTCTRGTHICKDDFTHGVFGAFHDTSRFLDVDKGKNSVCSLGDGVVVLLLVEEIVKDGVL